jgi:positive regulator of sigma E activity
MDAILGLSKTEKTLAILFIGVLAFLILRNYYKKTSESGYSLH